MSGGRVSRVGRWVLQVCIGGLVGIRGLTRRRIVNVRPMLAYMLQSRGGTSQKSSGEGSGQAGGENNEEEVLCTCCNSESYIPLYMFHNS